MIHVRSAGALDSRSMAELLNQIIANGGTTALVKPVTARYISDWMNTNADMSAWSVATDSEENVHGFQWIAPHPDLPPEACDVASFVRIGQTGLGIGSKLFEATVQNARALGYSWICACIRADNEGGLIYYQSRGFEDYGLVRDAQLDDGRRVDKVLKRYDL
ncbi:MAG: GNAT family N-acetyltransferase [Rhodobacteraceae bacterium]|nr:GNAT family N-acetyltransferase [Paracoccaceae bacterium]